VSEPFDIAIRGAEAFRFEHAPEATAYVAPEATADESWPPFDLDGRSVRRIPLSEFESVVSIRTWRVPADGAPERIDVDPFEGRLAAGERLVQVREEAPPPGLWPPYPVVPAGDSWPPDHESLLDTVEEELPKLAPEGWRVLAVECRATARRVELEAGVTFDDGVARAWSPPPLVGQWLHRLRMRDYRSTLGVWYTARLEFTRDEPVRRHFDIEGKPAWVAPLSFREELDHYADELRLLPRRPEAILPWLYEAAAKAQQHAMAGVLARPDRVDPEDEPAALIAPVFDDVDANGRPVAYRPMVGARERHAILKYLDGAPLALSGRGLAVDRLSDDDEPVIPLGYRTDGRWVWHTSVPYYLRKYHVSPALPLVDHIRRRRYRLPERVPSIALGRAADLAMGRYDNGSRAERALGRALEPLFDVLRTCQTSPRHYRLDGHQDQSWCLVREGDWYLVYWAEGKEKQRLVRFADVREAVACFAGHVQLEQGALRYDVDEELPWWQVPFTVVSEVDPPLSEYGEVALTVAVDLEVDRYGTPDGNTGYVADTPFEQRGLPAEHAGREYHRYRLRGPWKLVTAVSPAGGRLYVLPRPFADYLASGDVEEVTPDHPGLPPVTDALRAEARRNPGGWVWCADPDVDPRFIQGVPDFALLGAYRVGPSGELTGETHLNPSYRPSPRRRGYPEPQSDFEAVLGFVAAGWLPQDRVLQAALEGLFLVEADPQGSFRLGQTPAGARFLAVYTSPGYVPAGANTVQVPGRALLPVLAGTTLVINPGGRMGIELPGDDLLAAGS